MEAVGGGARAVFPAVPHSARGSGGCPRRRKRRRGTRDALSAAPVTVMLGGERPAMVAGEGGGSQ